MANDCLEVRPRQNELILECIFLSFKVFTVIQDWQKAYYNLGSEKMKCTHAQF